MKINSNRDRLLQSVGIVTSSVSSKTTLPILQNILLEAKKSKLKLVKTDLELATISYMKADIEKEGTITVPSKEFSDIINSLPSDKDISLYTDSSNKIHFKSGKSKFWLMGTPNEEYPVIPNLSKSDNIKLPVGTIRNMVQKTLPSVSTQETRYVLNGILWAMGKGGMELVSTDGRRLAMVKNTKVKSNKEFKIIIPAKMLNEFLRFLNSSKISDEEKIDIFVSSNQVGFEVGDTTFISRLIEGNFPNYEQVIPSKTDISLEVDTSELAAVTKRAGLCAVDRGGAVKYHIKVGSMLVSASSQRMEFSDEIKTNYKGADFECAFNPQYILDVLKTIRSKSVIFSLTNPVNPVVIEPADEKDCKFVIMPIRV